MNSELMTFDFPSELADLDSLQHEDREFCTHAVNAGREWSAACVNLTNIHNQLARSGRRGGGTWEKYCAARNISHGTAVNMLRSGELLKQSSVDGFKMLSELPKGTLYEISAAGIEPPAFVLEMLTSDDPEEKAMGRKLLALTKQFKENQKEAESKRLEIKKIFEEAASRCPYIRSFHAGEPHVWTFARKAATLSEQDFMEWSVQDVLDNPEEYGLHKPAAAGEREL